PLSTLLLPYTTLFRSNDACDVPTVATWSPVDWLWAIGIGDLAVTIVLTVACIVVLYVDNPPNQQPTAGSWRKFGAAVFGLVVLRSEEHTSELQSRENL